jgi:hypothetical protein
VGDDTFLTSAVVGEWSASRPDRFTPGTHWIGGWVDPRAGLDDVEKELLTLPGFELRRLGRQPVPGRYTNYAIPAHFFPTV